MPVARLDFMLADATPIGVITTPELRARLAESGCAVFEADDPGIAAYPATALPAAAPDDIAYITYTLGNHGRAGRGGDCPPQRHTS